MFKDRELPCIGLCVPMIYERNYINDIIALNENCKTKSCYIYEVYGSLRQDVIGNLRPSYSIKEIDISLLQDYIQILHSYNIQFDYVINSTLFPIPIGVKIDNNDVLNFLSGLIEIGVDSFTVSNPYIIMLLKRHFPQIKVNASICNEISTVHQIKEFEDIGVDCIVVDRDINRKFNRLKMLRSYANVPLKLLCNSPCLYQCINVQYHSNFSSFLSTTHRYENTLVTNGHRTPFCLHYCANKLFSNPIEHLKSQWIRPEDLCYYHNIGISLFKLDGRDKSAGYMLEVIKAYLHQKFEGNFFYLLHSNYAKYVENIQCDKPDNSVTLEWKIGIDNRKLDKFLEQIYNKIGDCDGLCDSCGICSHFAKHIVINKLWQANICEELACKISNALSRNATI